MSKHMEKQYTGNHFMNIVIIICIIVIIYSIYNIILWIIENSKGNKALSEIKEETTITYEDVSIDDKIIQKPSYDFTNLLNKNSDTIGWINVKNTNIDYPVVKHTDNSYYLTHSFDKSENSAGWIFADFQNKCDNSDYNTVIYGHNRKDKSMFGSLKNVLKSDWYSNEDNLYINFSTLNESHVYKIFSTIICNEANVGEYTKIDFASDSDFLNYINNLKTTSSYNFNTNLDNATNIITLYTCYGLNNQRLLVYAVLVE